MRRVGYRIGEPDPDTPDGGAHMNDDVLHGHLQHHWAAATGGVALFARVGRGLGESPAAEEVTRLAGEIADDRESLRQIMASVGVDPTLVGALAARGAELVGRLKPNGTLLRRSALTDVLELEALRTAVAGKRAGWELLRELAPDDERLDETLLDVLIRRADDQERRLRSLHLRVSADRMASPEGRR
jgi:hypothetical protein